MEGLKTFAGEPEARGLVWSNALFGVCGVWVLRAGGDTLSLDRGIPEVAGTHTHTHTHTHTPAHMQM